MQPETAAVTARALGARGSRGVVGDDDPELWPSAEAGAVLSAAQEWWRVRALGAGLSGPWLDVNHSVAQDPPAWPVLTTADLPDRLQGVGRWEAHELGQAYADALDPDVRARHARHYTPAYLARELWSMARRGLDHRTSPAAPLPGLVRDPASGTGALLLPALREHLTASRTNRAEPRMVLAGLTNIVEAIDTDPAAVWLANVILAAEALPFLAQVPAAHRQPLPALARVGDGLDPGLPPARAVLMNPPYGRVRLGDQDRERFAASLYGHANLYGLFLAAAMETLDGAGVLSALIPTSFTAGLYFRNLRSQLSTEVRLAEAAFVLDRSGSFTGVLQETCLASFTRRRVRRTAVASLNGLRSEVAKVPSPRGPGPWLLPRHSVDAPAAAAASSMPSTLGQAGWKASTGPLVWNRRRLDLHKDSGPGRVRVLWAADLDGGALHSDPARDSMRFFELSRPSDRNVMILAETGIVVQRTTAPEQRRRLVALELTETDLDEWGGEVVVENHVNVLRPRPGHTGPLDRSLLARVLATDTLDRVMRCMSGSVAVSAYELESLPLPGDDVLVEWAELLAACPEQLPAAVARAYRPAVR